MTLSLSVGNASDLATTHKRRPPVGSAWRVEMLTRSQHFRRTERGPSFLFLIGAYDWSFYLLGTGWSG